MNIDEEMKNPLDAAKFVTGTIISLGAAAAVVGMMQNPIKNAKGLTKLMMKLGVFVIGCKVGDVVEKYFNDTVDEMVKAFNDLKKEMGKA